MSNRVRPPHPTCQDPAGGPGLDSAAGPGAPAGGAGPRPGRRTTNLSSVIAAAAPNQLRDQRDDLQPSTTRRVLWEPGLPRALEAGAPTGAPPPPARVHTHQSQAVLWGAMRVAGALPCPSPGMRARGGQQALPRLPKTHDSGRILKPDREDRHRPSTGSSYLGPKAALGLTLLFPP